MTEQQQQQQDEGGQQQQQEGQQQGDTRKFAGKYDTPDALEQGIREARKSLNLPDLGDKPVFGTGGLYTDVSAAEQGYKELETLMGRVNSQQQTQQQQQDNSNKQAQQQSQQQKSLDIKPQGDGTGDDDADLDAILNKAGMNGQELAQTWMHNNGQLNDEQYAKFKEQGYSRPVVDAIMQGQQAKAQVYQQTVQQSVQKATDAVGGEQQLANLRNWAASNLSGKDTIFDTMNDRVANDPGVYPDLVNYVLSKHKEAVGAGNAKPLIEAGSPPATSVTEIKTLEQFQEASRKARQGDQAAQAAINAIPESTLAQWS